MSARAGLDPITLSVLSSALSGIAEEMGTVLVRSAYSSNIKERRDCSAALFDADGRMVAQAEHIPVHLGAMPEAVAAVVARDPEPGDVFVVNDPYSGGNHLPDVTMVSPLGTDEERWGYAVTRAHHSDIGGMQPGSMPAGSRDIWSEGLIIPPVRLVRVGATSRTCSIWSWRTPGPPGSAVETSAPRSPPTSSPEPPRRADATPWPRHRPHRLRRGHRLHRTPHP